jgi:ABC-type uncharacterized transport system
MTTNDNRHPESAQQSWVTGLTLLRQPVFFALLAIAILLGALVAFLTVRYRWEAAPAVFWGTSLGLVAVGAALWFRFDESPAVAGLESGRALVLIVGGLAGFVTWLTAVWLAVHWRATLLGGLEAWQGSNAWQLWVCLLGMFGGLALMFVSLLPARVAVRDSVGLRRLVFGYNTALTGLLVLAILLVVNVLVFNYFTLASDWTEDSIYTISDQSQNILKAIDKPAKVYVLIPMADDLAYREVKTLLDNCRAVNEKLEVEYVSPDLNPQRVRELKSLYPFTDREGLLVVYGPEGASNFQFIKAQDIFGNDPNPDPSSKKARFVFKGEDALVSSLSFLEQGKTKSVIYFLQGNGELDLKDSTSSQVGEGAGNLKDRLQKANYDVKGLQLSPIARKDPKGETVVSDKVPDDAEIVVIAGTKMKMPDYTLKALHDYMNPTSANARKGKLVVLLDTPIGFDRKLVHTGLEGLLADFNVDVGDDRVFALPNNVTGEDPTNLLVLTNPSANNPIAEAFRGRAMVMPRLRTVKPRPSAGPPGTSVYTADSLLLAPDRLGVWAETNFSAQPSQLIAQMAKDPALADKTLSQEPLSVAVTVTEPQPPKPGGDPHDFMRQMEQKPRLVVFGSAAFASNPLMTERAGGPYFTLLNSTLSWLRERPSNIGVEPKKRNVFVLNVDDNTLMRMEFLPTLVVLLGIACVGTGVWLVRRR